MLEKSKTVHHIKDLPEQGENHIEYSLLKKGDKTIVTLVKKAPAIYSKKEADSSSENPNESYRETPDWLNC